jgi:predicted nucleotidyltransferase
MATTQLFVPTSNTLPDERFLEQIRARLRSGLPELAEKYHIHSLGIFGSAVRGEMHPGSDLDLLIDFHKPPTLFGFVELQGELSSLAGVPVDLVMKDSLKLHIGRAILAEVIPL